jgi:RHS repeat-associated protein
MDGTSAVPPTLLCRVIATGEHRNASTWKPFARTAKRAAIACVFLALFDSCTALAQVSNDGISPATSFANYGTDSVNLGNLSVMLNIPVRSKAVGPVPFSYGLLGNSNCSILAQTLWSCGIGVSKLSSSAWYPGDAPNGLLAFFPNGAISTQDCDHEAGFFFSDFSIQSPDGTTHPIPAPRLSWCPGGAGTGFAPTLASDGSGFSLSISGWAGHEYSYTIHSPDGQYKSGTAGSGLAAYNETDAFGNAITSSLASNSYTYTDTLATTPLIATPVYETGSVINSGGTYVWTDVNSNNETVSETITAETLRTAFGCTPTITEQNASGSLITEVSYPDGSNIQLTYEGTPGYSGDYTGRINVITLRTGGTVTYTYSGGNEGINCTYGVPPAMTRQTSEGTWKYTWAAVNNGSGNWGNTTTVLDPGGNKKIYTFTGLTITGYASYPTIQALTEVQTYQNTGTVSSPVYTLLTTDVVCYNAVTAGCPTAVVSLPITERDVYHTINGMSTSSRTEQTYDSYGNTLTSAQYDFGASTPTFTTTTTYGSWGGSSCSSTGLNAYYIYNKPCEIKVTDGAPNTISDTRFAYTNTGELTTKSVWNGSVWMSNPTANSYNANGTIETEYDVSGVSTAYTYTSGCNGVLPTEVTLGGTLTTKYSYYCDGGVVEAVTDPNLNVTNYGYVNNSGTADPFWRLSSVIDPLNNETWTIYTPKSTETKLSFGSSTQDTTATVDTLGRPNLTQTKQGPSASNYDTISKVYNWGTSLSIYTSLPCSQTSGTPCGTTTGVTVTKDPLGRLMTSVDGGGGTTTDTYTQQDVLSVLSPAPSGENTKQLLNQYDGLGRLQYSCGILSVGGSSCGEVVTASGIQTAYTYVTGSGSYQTSETRGSQTRSQTKDAMGRVVTTVNPEAGTKKFYYDVQSSCSGTTVNGKLTYTLDANGNTICYYYDSLGRLSKVSANGTTCRHFYYDNSTGFSGTIPLGITISNSYGRMVEAATDNCSGTLITDEWLSYDEDGHTTDMWQSTPNSGQYYHSVATFFGNGTVNTLQLASPSEYTMTYGIDGEGRWNSVQSSSTQKYVTGTTYNAASQPTEIALTGTGPDQDDYVYDPNTGRMTKFTFQVGSTPATLVGQVNWNHNGTLNNLAITDGFNAGGTQACYYNPSSGSGMGYDDLGRLLSVSCGTSGSIWNQTFSYDQYDNLTKSSSGPGIIWNPGYSSSTNQYALAGATYDSDGDLTYDSFHNYTWNEFAKMKSVDQSGTNCATSGECIVYDALGRAVEIDKGSTYTEIWYTQLGKTAHMTGSTINYSYWPTPGGGTELIFGSGSSNYYMHKDWLGNARIISSTNAHTVSADMAFAPYGEIYDQFGLTGTAYQMFTGDTQDIVSQMMDTPNREYNSGAQGRWLSPDPAGSGWNLYAYSTNPNSDVDPLGLCNGEDRRGCRLPPGGACPELICNDGLVSLGIGGDQSIIMGNDIFDALNGQPGTFLYIDMYGNMGFGFDVGLWEATYGLIDALRSGENVAKPWVAGVPNSQDTVIPGMVSVSYDVPATGWVVTVQNLGTGTVVSGYLQDLIKLNQNAQWVLNNLPDDVKAEVQQAVANGQGYLVGAILMTEDPDFQDLMNQLDRFLEELPIKNPNGNFNPLAPL